jgi:hypothetical protein
MSPSHAEDPVASTVQSYFAALKAGDVSALQQLVGGQYYQQIKVLLEQNTEYPAFLQNRYAQTQFFIDSVVTQPNGAAIKARYEFGPQDTQRKLLIVGPDENGIWRVTQVRDIN